MSMSLSGALVVALLVAPGPRRCEVSADAGDATGVLAGTVLDARATTPVPHAIVTVMWRTVVLDATVLRTERHEAKARADTSGHYHVCGVPANVPVLAWASGGGARSVPAEIEVPADGELQLELRLPPGTSAVAAPLDTLASLAGRVRDAAGAALRDARVRIVGGVEARTDTAGRFVLAGVPAGEHRLEIASMGWAPSVAWVTLAPGERASVEVAVGERVPVLDAVRTVATDGDAPDGFARRRRGGIGLFLDRADIARRNAALPSDLLADLGAIERSGRGEDTGFRSARRDGRCAPQVFLDGTPLESSVSLDRHVAPAQIAAIEVYASSAAVPSRYREDARCGAVLVWTTMRHASR